MCAGISSKFFYTPLPGFACPISNEYKEREKNRRNSNMQYKRIGRRQKTFTNFFFFVYSLANIQDRFFTVFSY